jgi:hypothetical protein
MSILCILDFYGNDGRKSSIRLIPRQKISLSSSTVLQYRPKPSAEVLKLFFLVTDAPDKFASGYVLGKHVFE